MELIKKFIPHEKERSQDDESQRWNESVGSIAEVRLTIAFFKL